MVFISSPGLLPQVVDPLASPSSRPAGGGAVQSAMTMPQRETRPNLEVEG